MSNIAKKQGRMIRKGKEVRFGSVHIDLIGPFELQHDREAKGTAIDFLRTEIPRQQRLAQRLREDVFRIAEHFADPIASLPPDVLLCSERESQITFAGRSPLRKMMTLVQRGLQ
jgi:hypothetical protein